MQPVLADAEARHGALEVFVVGKHAGPARNPLPRIVLLEPQHRIEERPGVGMLRLMIDLVAAADLDGAAVVENENAVGEVLHELQVVRNEEIGQPKGLLQLLQQIEYLPLDRDIERRDRLVEKEEARLEGQRAGDADALALPPAELVRVAIGVRRD